MNKLIDFQNWIQDVLKKSVFQTPKMAESKLFAIRDCTQDDLDKVEKYLAKQGINSISATLKMNTDGRQRDSQGKPYPPSILVGSNKLDFTDWA